MGCLLLLRTQPAPASGPDVRLAQALADAATIGLIHAQTLTDERTTSAQLRTALHSRITIEQAKGALAQRLDLTTDDAFDLMRRYARHRSERLTTVARQVVDERLVPVLPPPSANGPDLRRARRGESDPT
ncbi:ANTAR domain-containing protein [Streptomyces monomycini]|uniref:ANTAR domain-containing protein n=1 Tax=Streptomyces monomycini TaxID=371720 RepID=UPI00067C4A31|nr:ANTAR domain-containing protein [Streptomyces monomycini]